MNTKKLCLLVALLLSLPCGSSWGTECWFFRVTCVEGGAPENLAITSDESGEIFLEFDTLDQCRYIIEATNRLAPSPAWTIVSSVTGDGQRGRWLTTPRQWSRTFGGEYSERAYSVEQTSDGGYIVAGWTDSFGEGEMDVYLVKTDADGNEVWTRTFGGNDQDGAYFVEQTSDGGYIVAGFTESFGAGSLDVYLVKTDAEGDKIWSKTFGGSEWDGGSTVHQTADGGFIVLGDTHSFGAGFRDLYLIKTDAHGNAEWTRTYGGTDWEYGHSVRQTSDGGYVLAGSTGSFDPEDCAVYLTKTDARGDQEWSRTFGGNDQDGAYSLEQSSDGGYIVAGFTESFGAGSLDVYLVKTDADGNEVWSRTFGGTDDDRAESVQQTCDRGYIVAGWTRSFGPGDAAAYLVKTDQSGNELWSRTFGGSDYDVAWSVEQTSDGGYIVAGYTSSFGAGDDDVYLIKTDRQGNAPPPPPPLFRQNFFKQNFDAYAKLYTHDDVTGAGWKVVNGCGDPNGAWRLWSTTGQLLRNEEPNIAGMSGNYMITDSDLAGHADMDEELITPEIDCTGWLEVSLRFSKNYRVFTEDTDHPQSAEVDIQVFEEASGWGDWVNLRHYDSSTLTEYDTAREHVDLSDYADGKKIRIRWHFYEAVYDWWFAIDDITLSGLSAAAHPAANRQFLRAVP